MSNHWDLCKDEVRARANCLANGVRRGTLNAWACEGLIDTFLEQPAFQYPDPLARRELKRLAMKILNQEEVKQEEKARGDE